MPDQRPDGGQLAFAMSVLYDASLLAACATDPEELLSGVARTLAALMPVDWAWLVEDDRTGAADRTGAGQGGTVRVRRLASFAADGNADPPCDDGFLSRLLREELEERVGDARQAGADPGAFPDGLSSFLAARLEGQHGAPACLALGARVPDAYDREHENHLYMLGLQVAAALRAMRLREELVAANARLSLVFESIDEGLLLLDGAGRVAAANPPLAALYFGDDSPPPGAHFAAWLLERAARWEPGDWEKRLARAGEGPFSFELVEHATPGDDTRPMAAGVEWLPVRGKDGAAGSLLILRDLRERKKAEELRRDLTAMLVHDLRSPLGIINWNMEMIVEGVLGEVNERQLKFLRGSIENSQELLDMIDSLLDIDRLETGALVPAPEDLDLAALAREVAGRMEFLTHQMDLSFAFEFPATGLAARADRALVRRVLFNLLFNASKYSPPSSTITVDGVLDPARGAVLGVRDRGPGIPRRYHRTIFDKYVQVEARHRGEVKGKGLGLTFCKLAVEAHGGGIWVESEEGCGSWFRFSLPPAGPPGD